MAPHGHFREPLAAADRKRGVAVFIHDVHIGKFRPAVFFQRSAVPLRGLAGACIEHVAFYDAGAGNPGQKAPYPFPGQNVGASRLSRMQLDGNVAGDVLIDHAVQPEQTFGAEISGEINLGEGRGGPGKGRRKA